MKEFNTTLDYASQFMKGLKHLLIVQRTKWALFLKARQGTLQYFLLEYACLLLREIAKQAQLLLTIHDVKVLKLVSPFFEKDLCQLLEQQQNTLLSLL
jgi:hypothetical protein